MEKYSLTDVSAELEQYETPFADISFMKATSRKNETRNNFSSFSSEFESPFLQTFEMPVQGQNAMTPVAGEFVQFLGELHDTEFSNALYELATELENTWSSKISDEIAMGETYIPFATQQAREFFAPLITETENMIDRVNEQFSGNNLADHSETEVAQFFNEMEFTHSNFSPAQEQFFGSVFNKIKSVVKTGVNLAKKGISIVGKILPIGLILNKLKALIKPLLGKVMSFAIGKLPKNLQPYAHTLAKKFLNLEVGSAEAPSNMVSTTGELEAVQAELDNHIANLVFSPGEAEAEQIVQNYEMSSASVEREINYETGGMIIPPLYAAREQFINELRNLQPGESAAPAVERFLPALMALQPIIKIAISIIGRQKIIDFLAGLLVKLVGKYVPENVARPLSASIIDVGMHAIGFETFELNKADLGYEAIANTLQETIQNIGELSEATIADREALTTQVLEAFEVAAANNFPANYIREDLRTTQHPGVWVMKPRNSRHLYKKYSKVFNVVIDPESAKTITTFRGMPLANFLRDKLGLDPSKPIQARMHLYEAIEGTWLSLIGKYEKVQGLGPSQPHAWVQLHPFTKQAATLLLKEASLGVDKSAHYTKNRHTIAVGQRFFYLEINGARLILPHLHHANHAHLAATTSSTAAANAPAGISRQYQNLQHNQHNYNNLYKRPGKSGDIQGVINFVKSEIRFSYYFSEEDAKSIVEKLGKNDFLGAAISVRHSTRKVLNEVLLKSLGSKVKIIHEAVPELFLDNYADQQEQFVPTAVAGAAQKIALGAGKELIVKLMEKLIDKLAEMAYESIANFFKTRATEFRNAQAELNDGVTIKIIWINIPGMSALRGVINAIRGNMPLSNLSHLSLPAIQAPEVKVIAGKHFD